MSSGPRPGRGTGDPGASVGTKSGGRSSCTAGVGSCAWARVVQTRKEQASCGLWDSSSGSGLDGGPLADMETLGRGAGGLGVLPACPLPPPVPGLSPQGHHLCVPSKPVSPRPLALAGTQCAYIRDETEEWQ